MVKYGVSRFVIGDDSSGVLSPTGCEDKEAHTVKSGQKMRTKDAFISENAKPKPSSGAAMAQWNGTGRAAAAPVA